MVASIDAEVCALCGVEVVFARGKVWLHSDSIPEGFDTHDVPEVVTRGEYLFGRREQAAQARAPQDRTLAAAERIADALERIAGILESR